MFIIKFNDSTTAFSFLCPPFSTFLAQASTPSHLCHGSHAGLWFHFHFLQSILRSSGVFWKCSYTATTWTPLGWLTQGWAFGWTFMAFHDAASTFLCSVSTHLPVHVPLCLSSHRTEMHGSPSFHLCPFAHAAAMCPFKSSHPLRSCCKFPVQPSREK